MYARAGQHRSVLPQGQVLGRWRARRSAGLSRGRRQLPARQGARPATAVSAYAPASLIGERVCRGSDSRHTRLQPAARTNRGAAQQLQERRASPLHTQYGDALLVCVTHRRARAGRRRAAGGVPTSAHWRVRAGRRRAAGDHHTQNASRDVANSALWRARAGRRRAAGGDIARERVAVAGAGAAAARGRDHQGARSPGLPCGAAWEHAKGARTGRGPAGPHSVRPRSSCGSAWAARPAPSLATVGRCKAGAL